jgi:hypothetical protein
LNSLNFYSSKNNRTILSWFFWIFILEVCVGGSGRLIQFGGELTLRKINFVIALLISFLIIFHIKKISKDIAYIFISYSILLAVATIIGFINYGNDARIIENILMQSFFLLLPFYSLFIKNEDDVKKVIGILKFASLFIAIIYLSVLLLIALGVLDFVTVYLTISNSVEFMGRGESAFWFKGYLYLCIGLYFVDTEENVVLKRIKQLIILVAVYFTFTRGFILALFVSVFLYQLFFRSFLKSALVLIFSVIIIAAFGDYYLASSFDRGESDSIRKMQLEQVASSVDPASIFIGHGFGKGVPIRDNHFEINYLEIFHKQGLVGLMFWFAILIYISILYINCKRLGYEKEARPFLLATLFVYIQSATNPYLTNSMGLNMIMISIVSLNVYLKKGSFNLIY